jgi:peptidyl-dipeptidase Dcp
MNNPLLEPWDTPFGAPPFDHILPEHFEPAFDVALADHEAEIEAIASLSSPPTFDNSVGAIERSGALLARVRRVFWALSSAHAVPAIREIEADIAARLTRHASRLDHDPRLFARVAAVWQGRAALSPEQRRLVENSYRGFLAGGALLDEQAKARFAQIDIRLGELSVRFGHNVLAANAGWWLTLSEQDCAGLPEAVMAAAARRAEHAASDGYRFTLDRGDVEDFLAFAERRDLREQIWRAFIGRCDGGKHDNWPIIEEIVALRSERARLLGFATYAEAKLEDSMASTPSAAKALLERLWQPARERALAEKAELDAAAGFPIEGWDWRFYAERQRRERFALDGGAVKAHLTLDKVRAAAFECASRLYGLRFVERNDCPGWHPDVRAWAVSDADEDVGLLFTDYIARPEKHGGAWMGALRVQETMDGAVLPIVYTVANFSKLDAGTCLSLDEARTLFHEFGHALHALLSEVTYPSLAGTSVPRDFVEFPSKFMEHWIVAPDVLKSFDMPEMLIEAIQSSEQIGQGFSTVELTGASIVDLAIHDRVQSSSDVRRAEREILDRLRMPAAIGIRHRLPHFTHIFDGGYAAAYYSYLWSEVLDADAFAAFETAGIFDRETAARFRREVLARGDTRPPEESFVAFRGRTPDGRYLLKSRGLVPAEPADAAKTRG